MEKSPVSKGVPNGNCIGIGFSNSAMGFCFASKAGAESTRILSSANALELSWD
jgi:hypothetical protein